MEKKFIDWHSADIIAALRKKGPHLQQSPGAMGSALQRLPTR